MGGTTAFALNRPACRSRLFLMLFILRDLRGPFLHEINLPLRCDCDRLYFTRRACVANAKLSAPERAAYWSVYAIK